MMRPIAALLIALVAASSLAAGPGTVQVRAADPTLPLAGVVVAIDPGHNGGNSTHLAEISRRVWVGTRWKPCNQVGTSTVSGYPEHAFNFSVALRVRSRLRALGATAYLTRTTDTGWGPCVTTRGRFAEKVGADVFVSIHGDGSSSSHRGFFVMRPALISGYTNDIYTSSARLAKAMRSGLLATGLPVDNDYATTGIKVRNDLGTLNLSDVPAVMVELGNMKNASDARRMKSTAGRSQYAAGLVAGIRAYLGR